MSTLIVTTILQASVLAVPEHDYSQAAERSEASGRPLVVLLGADWCPACKVMQRSTLPELAKNGGLDDVEFAYVDVDRNPELTAQLARGKSIPQLIRFEKTAGKWKTKHLIGGHSLQKVASFIDGEPEEKKSLVSLPISLGDWPRLFSRD